MPLQSSPFSSVNLRENHKHFLILVGVTVEQFDEIFEKVLAHELSHQQRRHQLWLKERVVRMVNKNTATLREHLCITLLYLRQFNIQEVLATSFGIS